MLDRLLVVLVFLGLKSATAATSVPTVYDKYQNVTYQGLERNEIEVFLNIPYGQDTGGANRFKSPQPFVPARGATIVAQSYGHACPQVPGNGLFGTVLADDISEDCLNLNIARPNGTCSSSLLPVMVYIHGGGLNTGQNRDPLTMPDALVLESIENGLPVIHVGLNYRLNVFGFARSVALQSERSENAGLKDQRLALEWVRDNIVKFGGDPNRITIFGQSSGATSVGLQSLAYGGRKAIPFQRAICESTVPLERGIAGNITMYNMAGIVSRIGCNTTSVDAPETVACLRKADMATLVAAAASASEETEKLFIGDSWLPTVDGDFLPEAPSQLISKGRFAGVDSMLGWVRSEFTQGIFTLNITTPERTRETVTNFFGTVSAENIGKILDLYPSSEFHDSAMWSAEMYRTSAILTDAVMGCPALLYGEKLAALGHNTYMFLWNQTVSAPAFASLNVTDLGVIHGSELPYVFGNFTVAFTPQVDTFPENDYALMHRGSRSWSSFAALGKPVLKDHDTFRGWWPSWNESGEATIFVAGGPNEGLSPLSGPDTNAAVASLRLKERCAFWNSPEMIEQERT
ncbi:putative lipase [Thozetella sp. PMI_491]|nr:putative lipase [Thozetella sp. PMI_491]